MSAGILLILFAAAIIFLILYFVIKAAVRDGIIEAHSAIHNPNENDENKISQITCPECGKLHDWDYPKCPYCKHQY